MRLTDVTNATASRSRGSTPHRCVPTSIFTSTGRRRPARCITSDQACATPRSSTTMERRTRSMSASTRGAYVGERG